MQKCSFCGSQFGDRRCYFCGKNCCTSCMTDDKSRCKSCYIKKRTLGWNVIKKNKIIIVFIAFLWIYAVFTASRSAEGWQKVCRSLRG